MQKGVDYIGLGVGAVIEKDGKYFLAKRGEEARNKVGKWEFPGGAVEMGDTVEETIVREMKEEHGIDVEVKELLDYQSYFLSNDNQHWFAVTFLCSLVSGEPKILETEKCEEIGWFTLDEIEKLDLAISSRKNLKSLLDS